jgi:transposase
MVVWGRLLAHTSAVIEQFVRDPKGHLDTEYLPACAPELNPVEYIWARTVTTMNCPTSAPVIAACERTAHGEL